MSNQPDPLGVSATFATSDKAPIPLRPQPLPMPTFPLDALGSLQSAVKACQELSNVQETVAAHSVLAAATLATQGIADVEFPGGKGIPLSCYFLTLAPSGDGKTTCSNYALEPIYVRQKELEETRRSQMQTWKMQHARWQKKAATFVDNPDNDLAGLDGEPQRPLLSHLICEDPTFEGLYRLFQDGQPSLGLISSEGGHFIGGSGMSQDNVLKMVCGLSTLWDGNPLNRVRAVEEASHLYGRRLAIHLMIQPEIAELLLANRQIRSQGFLSRCLIVSPESMAGQRLSNTNPAPALKVEMENYTRRLLEVMRAPLALESRTLNELTPRLLTLTLLQKGVWEQYQHMVEKSRASEAQYGSIPEFAAKIPSHVLRLAGVLTLVENPTAMVIQDSALAGAMKLGMFYLEEALRLEMTRTGDPLILHAEQLYAWLCKKKVYAFDIRYAQRNGPRHLRDSKILKQAISLLVEHRWLKYDQSASYQLVQVSQMSPGRQG